MKKIIAVIAVVVLVGSMAVSMKKREVPQMGVIGKVEQDNGRRMAPISSEEVPKTPEGKLKVANFSGKLEKVNVGCFVDAECYVVVDGKHVTAILGWRQEVVGTIQGVEGFGDLEQHIGEEVEVYAKDVGDGTYSLYGSEGFYIKLVKGSK